MKNLNKICIILLSSTLLILQSCKDNSTQPEEINEQMTITTDQVGVKLKLSISFKMGETVVRWIDLNDNGIEDSGEKIKYNSEDKEYTLTSNKVTIYGKVNIIHCENNASITAIDLSKAKSLTLLYCSNNNLTSLDISKTNMLELECNDNKIQSLNLGEINIDVVKCYGNQIFGQNFDKMVESIVMDNNGNRDIYFIKWDKDTKKKHKDEKNYATISQIQAAKKKNLKIMYSDENNYLGE